MINAIRFILESSFYLSIFVYFLKKLLPYTFGMLSYRVNLHYLEINRARSAISSDNDLKEFETVKMSGH